MMKLGMRLRDKITGFEGVAVCRTEYLHGCVRFGLQPTKLKEDGSTFDSQYFDEPQLDEVEVVVEYTEPTTGGPQSTPQRAKDPT